VPYASHPAGTGTTVGKISAYAQLRNPKVLVPPMNVKSVMMFNYLRWTVHGTYKELER